MIRVLFAGSPAIALPALAVAAENKGWELVGVLTNPDSRRGRSGKAEPTELGRAAESFAGKGLPSLTILKPERLGVEAREEAAALKPDLLVSFAYGRIFGPKFMALFPLGGINIHVSLLPRYRGASPIQEAILNRDRVTGICIQRIEAEMDTGNIIASGEIPLSGRETAASLSVVAAERSAAMLAGVLHAAAAAGTIPAGRAQEGQPSYCSRIGKDSGRINWTANAEEIDALVRAYTPWPLAQTSCGGQTLYILEAEACPELPGVPSVPGQVLNTDKKYGILIQTGGGILGVTKLQYQARKALYWKDFLNGARDLIGARLFSEDR